MRDEQLRRGQAPFLLPTIVLVGGVASDRAVQALAKRILYPPAGWLEELDDGRSVSGSLTVTFAGDLPGGGQAALLLRARQRGGALPEDAAYGPLMPLGHNAGARGWQPFVLPLGILLRPDMTVNLDINAPLSRLLLGRG